MSSIQRILVPIDFSDTSRQALHVACALVPEQARELHLLHVIPDPLRIPGFESPAGIDYYARVEKSWMEQAVRRLQNLVAEQRLPEKGLMTVALIGHPAKLILDYAEEQRVDLIVIGTQGENAVSRFLLGSVAERVVRHSRIPVLTVPPVPVTHEPATPHHRPQGALTPP